MLATEFSRIFPLLLPQYINHHASVLYPTPPPARPVNNVHPLFLGETYANRDIVDNVEERHNMLQGIRNYKSKQVKQVYDMICYDVI